MGATSISLVSMQSSLATSFASLTSWSGVALRSGMMSARTRRLPRASALRYAVTAESMPPLRPMTAPSASLCSTFRLMKETINFRAVERSSSDESKSPFWAAST